MTDSVYDGEPHVPHSGARGGYKPQPPFRVEPCNKMFNPDGTLTGNECPYGKRCTFLHDYKKKDCKYVAPDGSGCKGNCTYRHPGDPGYGEPPEKPSHAKKATAEKAKPAPAEKAKAETPFEMPPGVSSFDVLLWLKKQITEAKHPVLSAVFDGKISSLCEKIDGLLDAAKVVDAVRKQKK